MKQSVTGGQCVAGHSVWVVRGVRAVDLISKAVTPTITAVIIPILFVSVATANLLQLPAGLIRATVVLLQIFLVLTILVVTAAIVSHQQLLARRLPPVVVGTSPVVLLLHIVIMA